MTKMTILSIYKNHQKSTNFEKMAKNRPYKIVKIDQNRVLFRLL